MSDAWDETVSKMGLLDALAPSQAYLVVVRGNNVGETFPISGTAITIGRGAGADLRLNDEGVSRFHCKIRQEQGGYVIEDLGSRNGTFCNGEIVRPGRQLVEGDRLQVGTAFVLRFTYMEAENPTGPVELMHDPLTSTFSRQHFMVRLEIEVEAALARKASVSLILAHVDRYTELASEGALDRTVVAIANLLREGIQQNDVLARVGVGDFALMSSWSSPGDTFMLAERIRKSALATPPLPATPLPATPLPEAPPLPATQPLSTIPPITLSIGIASLGELQIETPHDFLVAAGTALQRARSQGGNRVVLCTPDLIREPRNRATV